MTSTGLKGQGFIATGSNPLGARYPLFEATNNFSLSIASENQIETGWAAMSSSCQQQTLNTIASSKALTLELTFLDLSWELLQHMMGEFAQSSASYTEGIGEASRVPLTTPFEYVNTDLTGLSAVNVAVGALSRSNVWGERGPRIVVTAPPADATEVQLDVANNKLVFHADAAGMPFAWSSEKAQTDVETIGVEASPLSHLELGYTGILCIDGAKAVNGVRITIPRMKFTENFSFEQGAEAPAPVLTYDLILAEGKRSVIEFARRKA